MKKIFIFALVVNIFCSCNNQNGGNSIEQTLKDYVISKAGPMSDKIDYKLISYEITDTIKAADRLNQLRIEILENGNLCDEITKESLLSIKNTELVGIDEGLLKRHQQTIDSLIAIIDDVSPYSFQLNFEDAWFYAMYLSSNGKDISDLEDSMDWMNENRDKYEEAETVSKIRPDEIYGYRIEHEYTIFNPILNKNVNIKNIVILNKDIQFVSSENINSGEDIMRQIAE